MFPSALHRSQALLSLWLLAALVFLGLHVPVSAAVSGREGIDFQRSSRPIVSMLESAPKFAAAKPSAPWIPQLANPGETSWVHPPAFASSCEVDLAEIVATHARTGQIRERAPPEHG